MRGVLARLWSGLCVVLLSGAALQTMSCNNLPTGPSLSDVALTDVRLQPTTGDASFCCCRATGMATNNNTTPVHVTVKFSAFDGNDPLPLATVIYFIDGLQPQAQHRIESSGFLFSCARIAQLKSEVDVRGLASPPN